MTKLYGIKNCDTVKKALKWLDANGIKYQFHDYKKEGIDLVFLTKLVEKTGFEKILNRKGTTWRQVSEAEQSQISDNQSALKLMQQKPSIIKRPILDLEGKQLIGFDETEYRSAFGIKNF